MGTVQKTVILCKNGDLKSTFLSPNHCPWAPMVEITVFVPEIIKSAQHHQKRAGSIILVKAREEASGVVLPRSY